MLLGLGNDIVSVKRIKNSFLFGKKFIKNKELETIDLIKSVEQESFFDFQKREFF